MIHNTHFSQILPPNQMGASAGTWTMAVASNVWSNNRSAADAAFTLFIPITIPSNSIPLQGAKLASIEIMYSIGTADMDDITSVKLYKNTLQASAASGSGTLNTAAEITAVSLDTGHDTAAERKAQDEHRMVLTLTTPVFIDNDEYYHVEVVCDAAAGSVFKYFGSIANFTLKA
jgi:hypothetical protein